MALDLLLLEIGNTNIHVLWSSQGSVEQVLSIPGDNAASAHISSFLEEVGAKGSGARVLVSSVNEALLSQALAGISEAGLGKAELLTPAVMARRSAELGLDVPNYHFLGGDLFCDLLGPRRNGMIVIDAGTAIKAVALDKSGHFLGGAIAPGQEMMRVSLNSGTSHAKSDELFFPRELLSLSTEGAISSGIVFGAAAWVKGLVEAIQAKYGLYGMPVFLTGGDCQTVEKGLAEVGPLDFILDPQLTLKGLAWAFGLELSFPESR
mgnify:CR=1 FL=1